jgi:hypothetical protein
MGSTENTGYLKTLYIEVTKYCGNEICVADPPYPRGYNGMQAFTWDNVDYPELDLTTLNELSYPDEFLERLNAWKSYVESQEPGLYLDRDLDPESEPYFEDKGICENILFFEILDVTLDCTENEVTITISGGTAPYFVSLDNGVTYSDEIYDTVITLPITSGPINILVTDSNENTPPYRWEEISCDQIVITFIPIYLTETSEGYIMDEQLNQYSDENGFSVTLDKLETYTSEAVPTNSTSFLGWSYINPLIDNYNKLPYISETASYTHTARETITIYGIFFKYIFSVPFTFCYFPLPEPGYVPTEDDLAYYCETCDNEATIYMDESELLNYGISGAVWYTDVDLTTVVPLGMYKYIVYNNDVETKTLYNIIEGNVISADVCDGEIDCEISPSPTPTPTITPTSVTPTPTPTITPTITLTPTPTITPLPVDCDFTVEFTKLTETTHFVQITSGTHLGLYEIRYWANGWFPASYSGGVTTNLTLAQLQSGIEITHINNTPTLAISSLSLPGCIVQHTVYYPEPCASATPTPTPTPTMTPMTNCSLPRYNPANLRTWYNFNFFGKGDRLDIINMTLLDAQQAIIDYCAGDIKTYHQGSSGINFFIKQNSTFDIGEEVYMYPSTDYCNLINNNFTTVIDVTGTVPCGYNGKLMIRVEGGYIVDKLILSI